MQGMENNNTLSLIGLSKQIKGTPSELRGKFREKKEKRTISLAQDLHSVPRSVTDRIGNPLFPSNSFGDIDFTTKKNEDNKEIPAEYQWETSTSGCATEYPYDFCLKSKDGWKKKIPPVLFDFTYINGNKPFQYRYTVFNREYKFDEYDYYFDHYACAIPPCFLPFKGHRTREKFSNHYYHALSMAHAGKEEFKKKFKVLLSLAPDNDDKDRNDNWLILNEIGIKDKISYEEKGEFKVNELFIDLASISYKTFLGVSDKGKLYSIAIDKDEKSKYTCETFLQSMPKDFFIKKIAINPKNRLEMVMIAKKANKLGIYYANLKDLCFRKIKKLSVMPNNLSFCKNKVVLAYVIKRLNGKDERVDCDRYDINIKKQPGNDVIVNFDLYNINLDRLLYYYNHMKTKNKLTSIFKQLLFS